MPEQVSHYSNLKPNREMGVIGYLLAAGVAVVLLPVVPFLAVLWLLSHFGGAGDGGNRGRPPAAN